MDRAASSKGIVESQPAVYDTDQGGRCTVREEKDAVRVVYDLQAWKAACLWVERASLKVRAVMAAAKDRTATADNRFPVLAVVQEDAV